MYGKKALKLQPAHLPGEGEKKYKHEEKHGAEDLKGALRDCLFLLVLHVHLLDSDEICGEDESWISHIVDVNVSRIKRKQG